MTKPEVTETELRVAKAAYAANFVSWDEDEHPWKHASERHKEMHIKAAKAAICEYDKILTEQSE